MQIEIPKERKNKKKKTNTLVNEASRQTAKSAQDDLLVPRSVSRWKIMPRKNVSKVEQINIS